MLDLMIEKLKEGKPAQRKVAAALINLKLEALSGFNPTLVGTFPIGIDIDTSDIDIICEVGDFPKFAQVLKNFQHHSQFSLVYDQVISCKFVFEGFTIDIYGEDKEVEAQHGYRHMIVEKRLLDIFGLDFKHEILALKRLGLKTEPAFALLLGLFGNPYEHLLKLFYLCDETLKAYKWSNPIKELSYYKDALVLEHLNKGWSHDSKLILKTRDNTYLIRLTPQETSIKKQLEFETVRLLSSEYITLPQAVHFMKTEAIVAVYSWIEGQDLEEMITLLSKEEQYRLGILAGKGLKDIQMVSESYDFEEKYRKKIDRVIENYLKCGVQVKGDHLVIDYLKSHKEYLKDRPITFQHGDYHIGNMIYTKDSGIGIVDFNRSDSGDPWEEYDRFVFTWSKSPYFAIGQLHGYFESVPDLFFQVVSLYNATNALAAIPWAIPFGSSDVALMIENYKIIFEQYEGFSEFVPKWYKEVENEVNLWGLKG